MSRLYLCVLAVTLMASWCVVNASFGVIPQDLALYDTTGKPVFTCRSGTQTVPWSAVNDDYCDCVDGSDEPGTSACGTGHFFCQNEGHVSKILPSSRVNDGICDCCDGSDEHASAAGQCINDCVSAGAEAREAHQQLLDGFAQGIQQRALLLGEAATKKAGLGAEEAEKQAKLTDLQSALDASLAVKEEQEALEAAELTQLQAAWDATWAELKTEQDAAKAAAAAAAAEKEGNEGEEEEEATVVVPVDANEAEEDAAFPYPAEYAFNAEVEGEEPQEEEIAFPYPAEYAFNEEADKTEENEKPKPFEPIDHETAKQQLVDKIAQHKEQKLQAREAAKLSVEEKKQARRQELKAQRDAKKAARLEKAQKLNQNKKEKAEEPEQAENAIPERPSEFKSEAGNAARKEHKKLEKDRNVVQRSLDDLTKQTGYDYGVDGEFIYMLNECYTLNVNQYVYEVCPFKEAKQKEGNKATRLGNFEGFHPSPTDPTALIMRFEKGEKCWNGPNRSLEVIMQCGKDTVMLAVDEPSKCVYEMTMRSPALCTQLRLDALLDTVNAQVEGKHHVAHLHDEL